MAKRKKMKKLSRPRSLYERLIPVGTVLALCGIAWFATTLELMPKKEVKPQQQSHDYNQLKLSLATSLSEEFAALRQRTKSKIASDLMSGHLTGEPSQLMTSASWQASHLLSARLLAPGVGKITDKQEPQLSYACFDLVYRSEQAGKQVELEAHKFGMPDQHIDVVEPVINDAGEPLGTLVASYNIAILQQEMNKLDVLNSYVELQQGELVLAAKGVRGLRVGSPVSLPVKGTSWRVALWKPSISVKEVKVFVWVNLILVIALAILVVAIGGVLAWFEKKRLDNLPLGPIEGGLEPDVSVEPDVIFQGQDALVVEDGLAALGRDKSGGKVNTEKETKVTKVIPAGIPDASIFKAYDIRGIVDKTLTVDAVKLIGQALGSEALSRGEKQIVVARDGRSSGPRLIAALIEGLASTGINVLDVGMVPTPVLYFAAWKFAHGTGVMLTGSHNPPDYNGLKMVIGENTLASEEIQKLLERIKTSDFVSGKAVTLEKNVIDAYIKRITDDVMLTRRFKVVVDCGNGVAGVIAPRLLKELGCDVVELYSEVDGTFPNHHPDPSKPENLKDVIAKVAETGADLGMAFDGDGDRLGVITSEGKVVWPDRAMMLYAEDILSRNPGAEIIYDVKCSKHLADVISQYGGKPTMWNTGHSLIKAKMKETGALLAGEMSGHIFFKERWFGFDDATYTAARLLELLGPKSKGGPVVDVFDALPDSVNTPEINVKMEEGAHHSFIKQFVEKARFEDASVSTIDGLRADFADGWGLVRASNTTPVLVLRFEADTDEALQSIISKFKEQMLAVDASLDLSF